MLYMLPFFLSNIQMHTLLEESSGKKKIVRKISVLESHYIILTQTIFFIVDIFLSNLFTVNLASAD